MTYAAIYSIIYLPVTPELLEKGGDSMEIFLAFLVSVAAGLFVEILCRWLDGHE